MPARSIIVGRRFVASASPGGRSYEYVLWADVPAARQGFVASAQASMVSAIPERVAGDGGATTAETTALRSGLVVERYGIGDWDNATYPTVAAIEAELVQKQAAFQAEVTANTVVSNPWANYGTSWNGTTWAVKVVA